MREIFDNEIIDLLLEEVETLEIASVLYHLANIDFVTKQLQADAPTFLETQTFFKTVSETYDRLKKRYRDVHGLEINPVFK